MDQCTASFHDSFPGPTKRGGVRKGGHQSILTSPSCQVTDTERCPPLHDWFASSSSSETQPANLMSLFVEVLEEDSHVRKMVPFASVAPSKSYVLVYWGYLMVVSTGVYPVT